MIRREKELASLTQAYKDMQEKKSLQLRFICGEVGSGKSVLTETFMNEAAGDGSKTLFISSCCGMRSEYNAPYQLFKDLLKNLLHDVKEENTAAGNDKKELIKERTVFCAKMVLEHAPKLIGNFIPGVSIISSIGQVLLNEYEKKNQSQEITVDESKILEQYVDAVHAIAEQYRLVLILDNLQWIDKSSVNLFDRLINGLVRSPVMIIGCYRSADIDMDVSGGKHPLAGFITEVKINPRSVFIDLDRLTVPERRDLMNRLLDTEKNSYDGGFKEKLFERTNGNPLFVNEMTDLLKEQGMIIKNDDGVWINQLSLRWDSYPVRIEGIIQERIGHLENSMIELLSHASVQGYSFIAQVLSKTIGEPDKNVLVSLSKKLQKQYHLVSEGSVIRSKSGIMSGFNFSSYLFQQYLYQELSLTERMLLHSDTAAILEDLFEDDLDTVAGDIAHHYEIAGENEKAVRYIKIAVKAMMRISAYSEAAVLCLKAQGFLNDMRKDEDVKKDILYFKVQLCTCYRSLKGWGDSEVGELYKQTQELSEELGIDDHRDMLRFGIWSIHLTKMELDVALSLAYEIYDHAKKSGIRESELSAAVALGNTLFWLGKLDEASEVLAPFCGSGHTLSEEDIAGDVDLNQLFVLMFELLIAAQKNETERGALLFTRIVGMTEASAEHFYKAVGYQALCWYAYFSGDSEKFKYFSEKLVETAETCGFGFYLGIGKFFFGASRAEHDSDEGLTLIQEGYKILVTHCQTEPTLMHSLYAVLLCNCYFKTDKLEECAGALEKAIEISINKQEVCYLDDLYFLYGKYYLAIGDGVKAEDYFSRAVETARTNGSLRIPEAITALRQGG